jgi:hypothetical protein
MNELTYPNNSMDANIQYCNIAILSLLTLFIHNLNESVLSSYVFYCGASETLNLCIVCGENPPVRFDLKCADTFRK